jgi:ankyrin repeat protein
MTRLYVLAAALAAVFGCGAPADREVPQAAPEAAQGTAEDRTARRPAAEPADEEPLIPIEGVNEINEQGFSKLHSAAMQGDARMAKQLLRQGADVNIRQAEFQGTPLQYAAAVEHLPVIEVLLAHNADVDARDTQGRTPLIWAALKGQTGAVRLLLDAGAEIAAATNTGWTALHYAYSEGHSGTVELLLERGAPADARNKAGKTPAELAPKTEN